MTAALIESLNTASRGLVTAGALHFIQCTVVAIVLAAVDLTLGRRLGAPWRSALWLIFFIKLALPPHLALPSSPAYWLTPAPVVHPMAPTMSQAASVGAETWSAADAVDTQAATRPVAASPATPVPGPTWQTLVVGAWAAGALALGAATLRQRRRIRTVFRHGAPASAALRAALARARSETGVRSRCTLRLIDATMSPVVTGLRHPTIHLSRALAASLTPEQLHAVLVHELLHVKRGDLWVAAMQTVARIVFFHHPAVWWVNSRLARLREEATDRAVLAHRHVDAHAYNLALVAAAELTLAGRPASPFALGVMETKSQLAKRIHMNLHLPRSRRAGLGRTGLFSLAVIGLVLLPMAPAGIAGPDARTPAGFQPLDASATVRQIDTASELIFAAFNRRDRDAYLAAFAPDAQILAPGMPLQSGRAGAAEGYLQAPPGLHYAGIRWKDRVCYRIGDWLIDTGLAEFQFRLTADAPVMSDPRQALTFWQLDAHDRLHVKVLAWNPLPRAEDFTTASPPQAYALSSPGTARRTSGGFGDVLQAETDFHRAFEEKRTDDAAAFYAADAILFSPETLPLRGQQAIRRYIAAVPPDHSVQRIERTVAHIEGDEKHVLVVNLFRWTFLSPGSSVPVSISGKGVHLWQREADGGWKVLFDLPNPSRPVSG